MKLKKNQFENIMIPLALGESESGSVVSDSLWPHGLYSPWNFPGQNTGVGSLSLLQRIFPTQGSNPGLPHCRWILHQLSHKGNPRILEWVAYPFSQQIFPTQESNQGLLHCRWILYQLSYEGSPWFNKRFYKNIIHNSYFSWKATWNESKYWSAHTERRVEHREK